MSTGAQPPAARPGISWMIYGSLALLIGVVMRFLSLSDPLWLDELHTAWCVSDAFSVVAPRAMIGNQSPLYFWLVYPVYHGFGKDEFSLRLVSLVASLLLLVSINLVVFRITRSPLAAVLCTMLAAIDESFVFYAVEARPYVVVQLVTVWQIYFFWLALPSWRQPPGTGATTIWVLLSLMLFYLHYTTLLMLLVQGLCLFMIRVARRRRGESVFTASMDSPGWRKRSLAVSTVLCFIPGIWHLLSIGRQRNDWDVMQSNSGDYVFLVIVLALTYVAIPAAFLVGRGGDHDSARGDTGRLAGMLGICVFAPMAVVVLTQWLGVASLGNYRFTISSSTVLIVLTGALIALINSQLKQRICVLVLLVIVTASNPLITEAVRFGWPLQRNEDWKGVANRVGQDELPIILFPNLVEDGRVAAEGIHNMNPRTQEYYRFPLSGIYSVDSHNRWVVGLPRDSSHQLSGQLVETVVGNSGGWLIVRGWEEDSKPLIEGILDQLRIYSGDVPVHRLRGQPLSLYRFEIPSTGQVGE